VIEPKRKIFDWLYMLSVCALLLVSVKLVFSFPSLRLNYLIVAVLMTIIFVFGLLYEYKSVSWVGIIPSIFLIFLLMRYEWVSIPSVLRDYAYLGLVMGISSFILYYKKKKTSPLKKATFLLYSLKNVFPLYLSYYVLGSITHPYYIYSSILLSVITWMFFLEAGSP